ncbi:ribosomal protein S1 [Pectinatus brassicae]|uniref:Ribosomal protein S1 n=2 Tax=Pectinatus brassicae TaxID=862415 RepID=A0A840UFM6_9FIRM|nr:30S ribosomal protein S1 [Pectinatus brassicae]MBB5336541.1 ribosomal protein S1 [Pectinatus brassicae]
MQEHEQDMQSLLDQGIMKDFVENEIIQGTVIQVDRDTAYVDIGYKQEIPISTRELAFPAPENAADVVSVGDVIDVYIVYIGGENGMVLSKRRADEMTAWVEAQKVFDEKKTVTIKVTKLIKGGLLVSFVGLRGFLPASQIELHFIRDLSSYVGKELDARIIELDSKKQRLIFSHRVLLEAKRAEKQAELLETLEEGKIVKGQVKRVVDYGAFIDLGGMDGLVHISDLSWEHVKHPSDIISVGEEVEVLVKSYDPETKRISLSIKDTVQDPWFAKIDKYAVGSQVVGKVVKLTDFGAFMQLEDGLDGLIRMRELSEKHITKADEVVKVGEEIKVKIIHIDKEHKRIALSVIRVKQDADKAEFEEYQEKQAADEKPATIADNIVE